MRFRHLAPCFFLVLSGVAFGAFARPLEALLSESDQAKLGKDIAAYFEAYTEKSGVNEAFEVVRESFDKLEKKLDGEGARFVATFPLAHPELMAEEPAKVSTPAPIPNTRALLGLRVLLVEDEEAVRRPVARYLARRGAETAEAANGRDAIAHISVVRPDVIVADLRMPVMDGVEFYQYLRRSDPTLAERVLFLSGDFTQLHELEGVVVPADRQLLKPVNLELLERRLAAIGRGAL